MQMSHSRTEMSLNLTQIGEVEMNIIIMQVNHCLKMFMCISCQGFWADHHITLCRTWFFTADVCCKCLKTLNHVFRFTILFSTDFIMVVYDCQVYYLNKEFKCLVPNERQHLSCTCKTVTMTAGEKCNVTHVPAILFEQVHEVIISSHNVQIFII